MSIHSRRDLTIISHGTFRFNWPNRTFALETALAGINGLEPLIPESKSGALPLGYTPIFFIYYTTFSSICQGLFNFIFAISKPSPNRYCLLPTVSLTRTLAIARGSVPHWHYRNTHGNKNFYIQQQSFFAGSLIFIAKIHQVATPDKVLFFIDISQTLSLQGWWPCEDWTARLSYCRCCWIVCWLVPTEEVKHLTWPFRQVPANLHIHYTIDLKICQEESSFIK